MPYVDGALEKKVPGSTGAPVDADRSSSFAGPAAPARPAFDLVVLAASFGGIDALTTVLGGLPADFAAPVLVVQHRSAASPCRLAEVLGHGSALVVRLATHGDRPRAGLALVAPPDRHLLVQPDGSLALHDAPKVNFVRPAADPLLESAAAHGGRVLAAVLTGRGRDGAAGSLAVRRAGGAVLVQEPATCVAPGMPEAALRVGAPSLVLPPEAIARALVALVAVPGADGPFVPVRAA